MAQLSGGPDANTPDAVGNGLAWQLRSGSLSLENGRVVLFAKMLLNATPEILATVQGRADRINAILDQVGFQPGSLEELQNYFNELEN